MPEWVGKTFGKVRIEKYLASGGMAEVYLGTHLTLDRPVAVKILHSHIESNPDLQGRFEREARAVAVLRHPNIVQILDFDTYDGHPYIVMEYLKGPTLSTYLRALHNNQIKIPLDQIAHLLGALASSLDYAHSQRIIHRDVKPANVLLHSLNGEVTINTPLSSDVQPVITDFGLARLAHSIHQTQTNVVSGTPAYMSPEQARGTKVDERSDIYSLGVMLYEMLAGRVPFEGESTITVILKHLNDPPPPIEDISPELQSVISKTLAKDPDHRYQSGRELAMDFYEAAGMHAEAKTLHALETPPLKLVSIVKRKISRIPLWLGTGILLCLCVSVGLAGTLRIYTGSLSPNWNFFKSGVPTEVPIPTQQPEVTNPSVGVFRFQDGSAVLDQITVSSLLVKSAPNTQYQAWLLSDDGQERRSLGLLTNTSENFVLSYMDPQRRNLLGDFDRVEITIERVPDNSPDPSDYVVFSSSLPPGSLVHIRHLLVAHDGAPDQTALAVGLYKTSTLIRKSADEMLSAYQKKDIARTRASAEAMLNLINGDQNADLHKDWDGDGTILDPGDGFGLLPNGDYEGYIDGTITYAELAAEAADSTTEIRTHAQHVLTSTQNVQYWAIELKNLAMRIAQAGPEADIEADVYAANALANQLLAGLDINGNETIDPIAGEGGALTAYQHAQSMADMPILMGSNQIP